MSKHAHLPANAFLKVKVGESSQRMHLQDLKRYRQVFRRRATQPPSYWHWKESQITTLPTSQKEETDVRSMVEEDDL